ncbi:MAG TPA: hypothetical protein VF857_07345, partial [Spirochaetota bacterium]
SQDFVPNKAPVVTSVSTVRYDGLPNDSENLISNIVFVVKMEAHDPEGHELSYSYSSDTGSFVSQNDTSTGSSILFVTGNIKAGDEVNVVVTVRDIRNGVTTSTVRVGQAKPVPKFITMTPETMTITANGGDVINVAVDCDGEMQLLCDNSISSAADAHIDTSKNLFAYTKASGTIQVMIAGSGQGAPTGRVQISETGVNKVWVIFIDKLGQETAALCTVTVN